ncbi:MAG: ASKHA domain-containing protein [Roseburia sp.]
MTILELREADGKIRQIEISDAEQTLLTILRERQIYLDAPCGGKGSCGRCRVRFLSGAPAPSEKEKGRLSKEELAGGIRLACAAHLTSDCTVELLQSGQEAIAAVTGSSIRENPSAGRRKQASGSDPYGIAIDIGTTTLAASLVSLQTSEVRNTVTEVNHQRSYGADVISRIQASNEGKGEALRESIRQDLRHMVERLTEQEGIGTEALAKIVIAANTAMCHLLLGFSCENLGNTPFLPVDISLIRRSAAEVLDMNREALRAELLIVPGISVFVGADIVAGIYETGMAEREEVALLLDIGTNGEMVIGNRNRLLATSTAAGPVFEGGGISCGVPGISGAITHVAIKKKLWRGRYAFAPDIETIAKKPPIGLCGTGIIDTVSELIRHGLIDENGTLAEEFFEEGFPVAGEEEGSSIFFTQRDIREVQMGKAAICAGLKTLIAEYQMEPSRIYLAGGFGTCMDVEKAIRIGLFPKSFAGKVTAVGNSSLSGAVRFLLEGEAAEKKTEAIAAASEEMNLAMHTGFQDTYLEEMFFVS